MPKTSTVGVSGVAVLFTAAGAYLIYAGIQDVPLLDGLKELMGGQKPTSKPSRALTGTVLAGAVAEGQGAAARGCPIAPVSTNETVIAPGTNIRVHPCIADAVSYIVTRSNRRLGGGGYRSSNEQRRLYEQNCDSSGHCNPPTARPGSSRHEFGTAVDFTWDGRLIRSRDSDGFRNLQTWAPLVGLSNLPSEPWHWSVDGH